MAANLQMTFNFASGLAPEDYELISKIQSGDKAAGDALIVRHRGLVCRMVKRYTWIKRQERDRAINAGLLGLWQAALKFDLAQSTKFSTWAVWQIRAAVQREFRQHSSEAMSIAQRLPECDGDVYEIADTGASEEQQDVVAVENGQDFDSLATAAKVSERDRAVFLRHLNGDTLQAIADAVGMSRERVRQIILGVTKRLRRVALLREQGGIAQQGRKGARASLVRSVSTS